MKFCLCLVLLIATCIAVRPLAHQLQGYTFAQYVSDFSKSYETGTQEYQMREALFNAKLAEVVALNKVPRSYKVGINHMSDWTNEERNAIMGRVSDSQVTISGQHKQAYNVRGTELPSSVDYRTHFPPVLTAVKDQGQCGSCWAHAATESIETHHAIATDDLFVLSQQQLTSCVDNVHHCGGTGGCQGATAEVAFDYVASSDGLTQEWMYPYMSYWGDSGVCNAVEEKHALVGVDSYVMIERNSDNAVADALVNAGPLAVSVYATPFQDYESGVFAGCNYSNNISMNHAVQLIGYGHDNATGLDYWLVRNSWSAGWGESGYIRLLREATPECGWNTKWVTDGGGCEGESNTVWACGECGILYDTLYPKTLTPGSKSSSSSGLSDKDKAVIGCTVSAGIVLIAVGAFFIIKRRSTDAHEASYGKL